MQSFPAQVTLTTTGDYQVIIVDNKCAVMDLSIQVDATDTSGTLDYSIQYTLWPLEKANYPTHNTPLSVLNAQAQWIDWQANQSTSNIYNLQMVVEGVKVIVNTAGVDDQIIVTYMQQGVR
jgi:hypothetical protein